MSDQWEQKVWGYTRCILASDLYSKHELKTISGSYCSLHYHEHRANRFIVKSGCIQVIELYGPIIKKTILHRDNVYDVPSLVPHMFVVVKDGIVIEEYYSDRGGPVKNDDIIRIVEGGAMDITKIDNLPQCLINNI